MSLCAVQLPDTSANTRKFRVQCSLKHRNYWTIKDIKVA